MQVSHCWRPKSVLFFKSQRQNIAFPLPSAILNRLTAVKSLSVSANVA